MLSGLLFMLFFFHIYLHSGEHTYFCPRVHPSLPEIKWTQSRRFKSQGTAGAAVRLAQPSVMKQAQPNRSRASYWKEPVVLNRDLAMGGNKRRKKKHLFSESATTPSIFQCRRKRRRWWIWRSSSTSCSPHPEHHGIAFATGVRYKYARNGKPWALDSLCLGIPGLIYVFHLNKGCWGNLTNDVWTKFLSNFYH